MNVGFTMPRFSTILSTRPSMAVAKPQASWVESSTLPKEWAIGSHRNCRSDSLRMSCAWIAAPFVDPRTVPQPHALGAAGGAGGVDQGGELVRLDRLGGLRDHVGVVGEVGVAELREVLEPDDPVAVGLAGEGDDLEQVRQLGLALGELRDLVVVLGEDDAALGVAEDVRRVLGVRGRVDRGRRRTGAHDGEVGEDPLVAGVGGDADPLLHLDAQREQPGSQPGHLVAGLLPGDRGPRLTLGVAVGLGVRRGFHPVVELDRHVGDHGVDEARVRVDWHCTPALAVGAVRADPRAARLGE